MGARKKLKREIKQLGQRKSKSHDGKFKTFSIGNCTKY